MEEYENYISVALLLLLAILQPHRWKNFSLTKGCLVIADRAYGTIKSIEHCLAAGSDFIIRIKNKPFHIYDENGKKIVLSDWLRTIGNTAAQWKVYIKNSEKSWFQ